MAPTPQCPHKCHPPLHASTVPPTSVSPWVAFTPVCPPGASRHVTTVPSPVPPQCYSSTTTVSSQYQHSANPVPSPVPPSATTVPPQCHPHCHPSATPTATPVPSPLSLQCHPSATTVPGSARRCRSPLGALQVGPVVQEPGQETLELRWRGAPDLLQTLPQQAGRVICGVTAWSEGTLGTAGWHSVTHTGSAQTLGTAVTAGYLRGHPKGTQWPSQLAPSRHPMVISVGTQ